jgi:hypothetical protein
MNLPLDGNREPATKSPFEQLGGEVRLRQITSDFIDRVFADRMIGLSARSTPSTRSWAVTLRAENRYSRTLWSSMLFPIE